MYLCVFLTDEGGKMVFFEACTAFCPTCYLRVGFLHGLSSTCNWVLNAKGRQEQSYSRWLVSKVFCFHSWRNDPNLNIQSQRLHVTYMDAIFAYMYRKFRPNDQMTKCRLNITVPWSLFGNISWSLVSQSQPPTTGYQTRCWCGPKKPEKMHGESWGRAPRSRVK